MTIDAVAMKPIRDMDERCQSFQIGMSHLTGGETWRTYDPANSGAGQPKEFSEVREARVPTDLSNQRLRTLAAGPGSFYLRYGGTTTNSVYFQDDD